jgi:hypothetical protein
MMDMMGEGCDWCVDGQEGMVAGSEVAAASNSVGFLEFADGFSATLETYLDPDGITLQDPELMTQLLPGFGGSSHRLACQNLYSTFSLAAFRHVWHPNSSALIIKSALVVSPVLP